MDIFTRAFNHTLVALDGAAQIVTNFRDFDMEDFENQDPVKAFRAAEAFIKGSFQSLNVSLCSLHDVHAWSQTFPTQLSADWTKKQTELAAAVTKDKERLTKLRDILSKVSLR